LPSVGRDYKSSDVLLGALLAGGRSSRFGGDKALALLDGRPLIDLALEALHAEADAVVICGRERHGEISIADRPAGGFGPLAGLNAALAYAAGNAFEFVLSAPIDVHPLRPALRAVRLAPPCSVLLTQWSIGVWPVQLGPSLDQHIRSGQHSFRSWIATAKPAIVADEHLGLRNFNAKTDFLFD